VLSYVSEERQAFVKSLGATDKARLDEYFSALRQIENQLALELERPAPLPSCVVPEEVEDTETGGTPGPVEANTKLFAKLIAHALACGQNRIFTVNFGAGLRKEGSTQGWHSWTHEEPVDDKLGYQPEVTWFINFATARFADFLTELKNVKEGDGTVLDRTVMLWQTDHGYARTHTMEDVPVIIVGNANGAMKTGMHISAAGDPTTRAGLTVMQAFDVPISQWGGLSNQTSKTISEIL
jgi:hypothetical protein